MTYAETLNYLYNKLPMFSRMGSVALTKDLTNTRLLCQHLGNPQQKFKSVHVAGTNGKGSVSHMLAAIFQKAGYKTGLYTSPHLYDFRERIRLNGNFVEDDFVVGFVKDIKPIIQEIQPSFFEITVAMAFDYFAKKNVDVAMVEVGLGGRLDSTNVIIPALSIITNIGWDHMNLLGNTLAEIAVEKAGIIKENIPVVIGETIPETVPVFEAIASEKSSPLYFAERSFETLGFQSSPTELKVSYKKRDGSTTRLTTDLPGHYQTKNLRTVLTAVDVLNSMGWHLLQPVVKDALKNVKTATGLHGRWEVIGLRPTVVLEVAHNKNGIEQMLNHLSRLSFSRLHIVFGMVRDKEAETLLSLLPASANYYFAAAHSPRALPADELKAQAEAQKRAGESHADVNLALKAALANAGADDLIVVCGSIFLVAEVDRGEFAR